jgi:hypothetical protein
LPGNGFHSTMVSLLAALAPMTLGLLSVPVVWCYPYVTDGGFQSIGLPPNHPVYFRIFHCKASSYWGTPMA